jgi:preprotein translocase subunit SecD
MKKNLRSRTILIGIVTLASLIFMFGPFNKDKNYQRTARDWFTPGGWKQNLSENIRLGLDLKGGTHLLLQVQTDDAINALTEGNRQKAVDLLKKDNVAVKDMKVAGLGQLVIETADDKQHSQIREKLLADFGSSEWDVSTTSNPPSVKFTLKSAAMTAIRKDTTNRIKEVIEQRVNAFGVAEPTIQLHGREEDHQILVQMPGVDDPERVKALLKTDARLELKAVDGTMYRTEQEAVASLGGTVPGDKQVLKTFEPRRDSSPIEGWYVVERTPIITGNDLRNAFGRPSQQGINYDVVFNLKPDGAEKFRQWTGANIGRQLAIVLNDEIKSAPSIRSEIGDTGQIEGNFSQQEAEDLGLVLRSGALPAKVVYREERTVGPSLGADSIRQGVTASIVGLGLVVLFMLFYYRLSGVNAVVALVLNLLILLAGLAMFGATLTLPGIAGVILLIGMAVDSNVLIFERVREELKGGKPVSSAVDIGFNKALVTIIDTHVTTIVSCFFLFIFGTGPIRGFAVTLVIGLLANLFTAVHVSRTMFLWALNRGGRKAETLSI